MKKILSAILLILIFSSVSYGAVSQDIYVRQDVFDAKMEALFSRLHGEIMILSERMDKNFATLSARIDALSVRIDTVDKRIDDVHNFLYWLLVLFSAMLLLPFVSKWLENYKTPQITLEQVKQLIAEAQLSGKPQA